jgi:hypothetical protein
MFGGNMNEQTPLPYRVAALGEARCIAETVRLLARRRMHLPESHVGLRIRFADGTSTCVYRETVVDVTPVDPCVLLVEFKLRFVRGWGHALFRRESLLNTPLFVGFPGFVSKLWMAHDENGVYRGVYEWDGPERAENYARSLWRVLAIGSVPGSIHYHVLPKLRRDEYLAAPDRYVDASDAPTAWWRVVSLA